MDFSAMIAVLGLTARQLNAIGLICGFTGAIILALWGSAGWQIQPNGYMRSPGCRVQEGEPGRERAVFWLKVRHMVMPKVGLGLVAITFLAQLLALWAPST
jgi:hypothetical protein